MSVLIKQDIVPREPVGLVDGEHHILKCSGCDEPLADIWSVKPDANEENSFIAECPCGDKSYIATVKGRVAVGSVENGNVMLIDIKSATIAGQDVNVLKTISVNPV